MIWIVIAQVPIKGDKWFSRYSPPNATRLNTLT